MSRKLGDGIALSMTLIGFLIYGLLILNPDLETASSMTVMVTKGAVGGVLILVITLIGLAMKSNDIGAR